MGALCTCRYVCDVCKKEDVCSDAEYPPESWGTVAIKIKGEFDCKSVTVDICGECLGALVDHDAFGVDWTSNCDDECEFNSRAALVMDLLAKIKSQNQDKTAKKAAPKKRKR